MVRPPWPTQLLGPLLMQPPGASQDGDSCGGASRFSTAEEVSSHCRVRSGNPDIPSISLGRRLGLELSSLSSFLIRSCRLSGQSIRDRSTVFLLYKQLTGGSTYFLQWRLGHQHCPFLRWSAPNSHQVRFHGAPKRNQSKGRGICGALAEFDNPQRGAMRRYA